MRLWPIVLLSLVFLGAVEVPEVFRPKVKSAEVMAKLLEPFLEPGGAITIVRDQLLVKASAGNRAELRRLMEGLDQASPRLRISIRRKGWTAQTESEDGQSAILRSQGSNLVVRPRRVPGGIRMELLAAGGEPGSELESLAVVQGRLGRWLPAGASLEIRAELISSKK